MSQQQNPANFGNAESGYTDKRLTCFDCKDTFTFTEGEQAFYAERELQSPKRCKECRRLKREAREALAKG